MSRMSHDLDSVLTQAAAWKRAGLGVALATVVRTWGSSPRPAGSKLAVNERGEFVGSVSGGCIEGAVITEALEVMRGEPARVIDYGVSDEAAGKLAPDTRTAVVTLTHDPKLDDPALIAALASPAFYLGCLGSKKTH